MPDHYLKALFDPASVVVIGASETENTHAACITAKLQQQFTGKLYFINPRHKEILDRTCYKKVVEITESIDLAIIISPLKTVKNVIRQCAKQGISNAIVMTKFPTKYRSEVSDDMKSLRKVAEENKVRLLGPNASSLIRPSSHLYASFTDNKVLPGKLAVVSRSTTICNSIIHWAEAENIGFSSIISRSSDVDIDLADILDFLADDYRTDSIILYINHIRNTRRLMSALRAAAKVKPVVILKASRDDGSYCDVVTGVPDMHTSHDTFLAAMLRAGADYVYSLTDLFAAAKALGSSQRTRGNRLGIVSNGYGPVLLANDRLKHLDIPVSALNPELAEKLTGISKSVVSFDNAVAIFDEKNITALYVQSVQLLIADKNVDAVAIFLAPDALINSPHIASEIAKIVKQSSKPVLPVWLGADSGGEGRNVLIQERIANYRTPEVAINAFSFLHHHFVNRQRLLQVPFPLKKTRPPDVSLAKALIQQNLDIKRYVLSTEDSIALLEAFHIKCNSHPAGKIQGASSSRLLKINILNDYNFGPVISLGLGGALSALIKDRAIQLPPLNQRLTEGLINDSQVSTVLNQANHLPQANRDKLREVLIKVSEIATHLPEVFELTLDSLIIDENDAVVSDVRIVIQKTNQDAKLFSHLAIHPYPSDWHRHITIKNNEKVEVRPIRAEDAEAEIEYVNNLSSETKYSRFMYAMNKLTPEMLSSFTKMDYDREMAFGAFTQKDGKDVMLGVSRYAINPDKKSCEFAIAVDDNYHGMGLARQLMLILIEHVKDHDLTIIEGTVLKNNTSMDKLMASLGFKKTPSEDDYSINVYTLEY